jgi:hypothetical protein
VHHRDRRKYLQGRVRLVAGGYTSARFGHIDTLALGIKIDIVTSRGTTDFSQRVI